MLSEEIIQQNAKFDIKAELKSSGRLTNIIKQKNIKEKKGRNYEETCKLVYGDETAQKSEPEIVNEEGLVVPSIEPLRLGIQTLREAHKQQERWQDTFDEMLGGQYRPVYFADLEKAIVKMLESVYHDSDVINWFLYHRNVDRLDNCKVDIMEYGKIIPMATIEDLYDYLIKYRLNKVKK